MSLDADSRPSKYVYRRTFTFLTQERLGIFCTFRQTPELRPPPPLPSLEFTHLNLNLNLNHTNSSPVPQQLLTIPQNA
jgi:hypothetical protein